MYILNLLDVISCMKIEVLFLFIDIIRRSFDYDLIQCIFFIVGLKLCVIAPVNINRYGIPCPSVINTWSSVPNLPTCRIMTSHFRLGAPLQIHYQVICHFHWIPTILSYTVVDLGHNLWNTHVDIIGIVHDRKIASFEIYEPWDRIKQKNLKSMKVNRRVMVTIYGRQ